MVTDTTYGTDQTAQEGTEMTPKGAQAQEIQRWVFDDPASRAVQGMGKLRELARDATGQELTEIQDAGQSVSRLLPS